MKHLIKISLVTLCLSIFISSCQNKDQIIGKYQSGVLVVNEGGFGSANGDVTFYSNGTAQQAIYKAANGSFPGDVLESITIDGNTGYLVLNGSNKIEVVNDNTFQFSKTITHPKLINPRYLAVINGKAYVSNWGPLDQYSSPIDSYVLVFDTKTYAAVDTVDTDEGTENLLYNGQYLFASNFNYGASNSVNVIDPTTNQSIKTITLYAGPGGMVTDSNNKLWVIAQGTYNGNDGKLFRVNPSTFAVEQTIELGVNPTNPDLAISPDEQSLYYYVGTSIYKIGIDATAAPSSAWVTNTNMVAPYSLGVDPKTGDVYWGDALNYSSQGTVYIYGSDANLKTSFTAGIDPGEFIFR